MEQNVIDLITNFGFPVVLSGYLLIRFEKKLEYLTISINELNKIIQKCTK